MRGHGVHVSRSDDGAAEGLLLRCCETLCNVVPVEDVPDGLDVIRLDVLVLHVESVLPHIQHQQWGELHGGVALLVGQLLNEQAASNVVVTQHGPAGTLQAVCCCGEVCLELLEGTEVAVDSLRELTGWLAATVRAQVPISSLEYVTAFGGITPPGSLPDRDENKPYRSQRLVPLLLKRKAKGTQTNITCPCTGAELRILGSFKWNC